MQVPLQYEFHRVAETSEIALVEKYIFVNRLQWLSDFKGCIRLQRSQLGEKRKWM